MKSFICVNCEKSFTRTDGLKRHQKYSCKKTRNSEKIPEPSSTATPKEQQQQLSASIPKKTAEQQQEILAPKPENTTTQQQSLPSDPEKTAEQPTLKTPSPKKLMKQFTFKIQFNPTWDEMLLGMHNKPPFGLKAQKYLLEELYFDKYEESCKKLLKEKGKDESVKIIARFKYINRLNEQLFKTVEFNTILNGENPRQEYLTKVTSPIVQKITEMETEKTAIIMHMCFIKFFFENLQPLESQAYIEYVQINNREYKMDEDCKLTFIDEKEEEIPGYRHM